MLSVVCLDLIPELLCVLLYTLNIPTPTQQQLPAISQTPGAIPLPSSLWQQRVVKFGASNQGVLTSLVRLSNGRVHHIQLLTVLSPVGLVSIHV
ncbi:hypothetical protein Pmani_003642 [Petrolisthes manimaculis]|uniref:Secreted protein n=1 Tax=Petrolisthes manimaculis TaxID=1843537 RepID=A0AAE1UI56_9EUCA|nr:hypothetical protein Pmani_003642 [Petrolisthes manimaculis]